MTRGGGKSTKTSHTLWVHRRLLTQKVFCGSFGYALCLRGAGQGSLWRGVRLGYLVGERPGVACLIHTTAIGCAEKAQSHRFRLEVCAKAKDFPC